jgi:homoserine kinase type II
LDDFAEGNQDLFGGGLAAYRAAGGRLVEPDHFVRILAETGAVCSVIGWLVRASSGELVAPDGGAITARVRRLLARLARIQTL